MNITQGPTPCGVDRATILAAARAAYAAAEGDSNDDEIAALRDALDACLAALGIGDADLHPADTDLND